MPPTHPSQADVAAAYRTLIAHETEPKEQDFYRTRLQRLEPTTEPVCELDCRSRLAAAGVGVYCPQCSAKCADTDLTTQLAKAIRAAWVDRLDWDELARAALKFLTSTGRLVAAGGMALTAEQVLDLKNVLDHGHPMSAQRLLDALFPATEPAEEETKAHCLSEIEGWVCSLTSGHDGDHIAYDQDRPAYTWPTSSPVAGEGTRAECVGDDYYCAQRDSAGNIRLNCGRGLLVAEAACTVNDVKEWWVRADRGSKWERQYQAALDLFDREAASSPVVPTPTETDWQTWQEVPEGVKYWRSGWPNPTLAYWVNRGGVRFYADAAIHEPFLSDTSGDINLLAPFVAAEEG